MKNNHQKSFINHTIQSYIQNGSLVRLSVVKGRGVTLSIPCRILQYDEKMGNVTVYHVDEKQVYTFSIYEIEDVTSHETGIT